MPTIPDIDNLGARPVARSRRPIVSNPAAGAVGRAAAGVGDTLTRTAEVQFQKQDRLAYAAAKVAWIRADTAARAGFESDPDFATFETRYGERMKEATTAASAMIPNRADRAMFTAEIEADLARGTAQVAETARGKRNTSEKALLNDALETLMDSGRDAPDEATRWATVETAREMIGAAKARGILDPLEESKIREGWASNYATQQVTMALNREDPIAATAIMAKFGDLIQWQQREALEARIKGVTDEREAVLGVNALMGTATEGEAGPATSYADPLRGKGRPPVPGGQYGASRDYGAHQGVDFPAPNGTPIHAIAAGKASVSKSERGGNIVTVKHGDGTESRYMHLGAVNVKDGDIVGPDTVIGAVGTTGRSTGPHLHMEVTKDGKAVDPGTVIGRAQQSPRRHDLNQLYAQIDVVADAEGWTPEKRERWKEEVDRRVARDETLANRADQASMRSALDTVDKLGDNFTDISQVPNAASLAPDDRLQLERIAQANRRALQTVTANGDTAITLKVLAARDPEAFKSMDLRAFRPFMTPGEFESLAVDQAQLRAKPADQPSTASVRSEIDSAIRFYGKEVGLDISDRSTPEQRQYYGQISDLMRTYLDRATEGGKRKPTDDDMKAAFDSATMKVIVRSPTSFLGIPTGSQDVAIPRYAVPKGANLPAQIAIPADVHARITASLKRNGLPTDDDTISRTYLRFKGQPGYWR